MADDKNQKPVPVSSDDFIGPKMESQLSPSERKENINRRNVQQRTNDKGQIPIGLAQQNPETRKKMSDNLQKSRQAQADHYKQQMGEQSKGQPITPFGSVPTTTTPSTTTGEQAQQATTQAGSIQPLVKGDTSRTMLHADVANQVINTTNALWNMRGSGGIRVYKSGYNVVIDGANITGSSGGSEVGEGSAVAFRGYYNSGTNYNEGDVVFIASADAMAEQNAHTYVSLKSNNIGHLPPATTNAWEDEWWRVVSVGSYPMLSISYPPTAPSTERRTDIVGGGVQAHYKGSAVFDEEDEPTPADTTPYDTSTLAGGNLTVGKSITVEYGPVTINFPNGAKVIFNFADMEDTDMAGKEFRLREIEVCESGIIRYMGVLATELYDKP